MTSAFPPDSPEHEQTPPPELHGVLHVRGEISSAHLHATAHGIYAASTNGRRLDDSVLAPG
jgi:alpha-L-rhamnosidase